VDSPAERAGDRKKNHHPNPNKKLQVYHASRMKILAVKLPRIVQLISPGL